jgi:hypothetical protein
MHHLMVGVRLVDGRPGFFGWDEVNEYIRHGTRVARVEPRGVFGLPPDVEPDVSPPGAWYFTVVLGHFGIDPA